MTHEEEWAVKIRGGNRTVMIGGFCSKEKVSKHNLVGKRWCCLERQEKLKLKCLIMKSRREKVPDNLSHGFWINSVLPRLHREYWRARQGIWAGFNQLGIFFPGREVIDPTCLGVLVPPVPECSHVAFIGWWNSSLGGLGQGIIHSSFPLNASPLQTNPNTS